MNYACSVPCSMYSVLIKNGVIPNPYVGLNEDAAVAYYGKDCVFSADFCVSSNEIARENVCLRFGCLDTLCDIYLNGELLGHTDNFHLEHCFNVKNRVKTGKNSLKLRFYSAVNYINEKQKEYPLACYGQTDGRHGALFGFGHIRKPNYAFGWDWGPCLPDAGILKPVELACYDDKIEIFNVIQRHEVGAVTLEITAKTLSGAECFVKIIEPNGCEITAVTVSGMAEITIKNPQLWWPNGYGEQPLYKAEATVCGKLENDEYSKKRITIGLRTLEVLTAGDCYGREFTIAVNGLKIFAMGANFIPTRVIIPERTREQLEELVRTAVSSNFNILRVWGGGVYESEDFYNLCDENGLLVWQDCAVACTQVRANEELASQLEAEIRQNVARIKTHPSLAVFAGNNEVEQMILDEVSPADLPAVKQEYVEIFEKRLPAVLKEVAPEVFYWPSSPCSGGNFYKTHDPNFGDGHYWSGFSGFDPLEKCRTQYHRFLSEFGFQAYPPIKTLMDFADESDLNAASPVMDNHQRSLAANRAFGNHVTKYFLYPESLADFAYATQLVQVKAIKLMVEHLRANRGRCMGAIYWQLNDCWPVISWSSVDWKNRYKPLQYAAKRMFAPVIITCEERDFDLDVYVSAERAPFESATLKISVKTNANAVVYSEEHALKIASFNAEKALTFSCEKHLKGFEKERYVHVELFNGAQLVSQYIYIAVKPKLFNYLPPNLKFSVQNENEKTYLVAESAVFVDSIVFDTPCDIEFADNLLFITGESVRAELKNADGMTEKQIISSLIVHSVYDIAVIKKKTNKS